MQHSFLGVSFAICPLRPGQLSRLIGSLQALDLTGSSVKDARPGASARPLPSSSFDRRPSSPTPPDQSGASAARGGTSKRRGANPARFPARLPEGAEKEIYPHAVGGPLCVTETPARTPQNAPLLDFRLLLTTTIIIIIIITIIIFTIITTIIIIVIIIVIFTIITTITIITIIIIIIIFNITIINITIITTIIITIIIIIIIFTIIIIFIIIIIITIIIITIIIIIIIIISIINITIIIFTIITTIIIIVIIIVITTITIIIVIYNDYVGNSCYGSIGPIISYPCGFRV
ncbi:hypothetical protein SKAU_G00396570 [Synaphobranchus kaupii]|uniref:Uncharacterized protein n=1 Tax=Synaphobranchus kaupii TaxID=118154 RepID=A0A9Q1IE55_SYNKA|nr:hypothetical protein SKAU_G00396570 [Synaphobranchus kaupii]